jgi:hypothetical protein
MLCPKCKAKIGIIRQQLATETGQVTGILCYICGFWKQEKLKPTVPAYGRHELSNDKYQAF